MSSTIESFESLRFKPSYGMLVEGIIKKLTKGKLKFDVKFLVEITRNEKDLVIGIEERKLLETQIKQIVSSLTVNRLEFAIKICKIQNLIKKGCIVCEFEFEEFHTVF